MIYCVVPEPLADELYPKLSDYYEDDPNVTVIVDRRKKERRLPGSTGGGQREVRDRRRARITGDFPPSPASSHRAGPPRISLAVVTIPTRPGVPAPHPDRRFRPYGLAVAGAAAT